MNRIIKYCTLNFVNIDSKKIEIDFIKGLHKNLFPNGFIQKSRDINGKEFIQMIPGEYRNIDLKSKTNSNKSLYLKWQDVENGLKDIIGKFNNSDFQIDKILLFLADFSRVHPFLDGNGRTIDILVDLFCLKNGFKPFYFGELKHNDEVGFYKVLDNVYETRDVKYFYDFVEKFGKS